MIDTGFHPSVVYFELQDFSEISVLHSGSAYIASRRQDHGQKQMIQLRKKLQWVQLVHYVQPQFYLGLITILISYCLELKTVRRLQSIPQLGYMTDINVRTTYDTWPITGQEINQFHIQVSSIIIITIKKEKARLCLVWEKLLYRQ